MAPTEDYSNDPMGSLNRFINWAFMGRKPRLLRKLVCHFFHIVIPPLDYPLRLPHPYGVFINPASTLGRNVTIFQGTTVGSKRSGKRGGVPTIGDDVVIGANCVILGRVHIGDGALIAPGSVVVDDVPAGAIVAGPHAQVLGGAGKALQAAA